MKIRLKLIIKSIAPYGLIVLYKRVKPLYVQHRVVIAKQKERNRLYKDLISNTQPIPVNSSPEVVVSLTSYGRRVSAISHIAIASLLRQSKKPDKVVLWLAQGEKLSKSLIELKKLGLDIEFYADIKSYKKLIPALKKYPKSTIITADDDVVYPADWLEKLIAEHNKYPDFILANRAREIKVTEGGEAAPYAQWQIIKDNNTDSQNILPTGVGGVLYPHGALYKDVHDESLFTRLAPHGDDLWFWAMAELKGTKRRIVVNGFSDIIDHELDPVGLWNTVNSDTTIGNDIQFTNILDNYPKLGKKLGINNSKSDMTGLRVSPGKIKSIEQQILLLKHQFAYKHAVDIAKEMKAGSILDYGCGDGYGSDFMAEELKHVTVYGTDIDKNALIEASHRYKKRNLRFVDVDDLKKYDLVVSFQVIEHVEDVAAYLIYLKEHLTENGKIVIATPDRNHRLNEGQRPWNPFHLREYDKAGLQKDLKKVFRDFTVYQLTGDKNMLRIEYSRVAGNREDRMIYGGVSPKMSDKTYSLNDFRLSRRKTEDGLDLIAVIDTSVESRRQS